MKRQSFNRIYSAISMFLKGRHVFFVLFSELFTGLKRHLNQVAVFCARLSLFGNSVLLRLFSIGAKACADFNFANVAGLLRPVKSEITIYFKAQLYY
jgi:hypothetical protein